jgi:hypothetical protein
VTAVVTGQRPPQYLIDLGDGRGFIYDAELDVSYPPRAVVTLASQPYWEDPVDVPAAVQARVANLNAPSESILAMAEPQVAGSDVPVTAFDTAFKTWFFAESDPLAVMMGMKDPDHPIPKPPTVSAAKP